MKTSLFLPLLAAALLLPRIVSAQTTAFTYQGRLTDNNFAANGNYDVRFGLYAASSGGTAIATQTVNPLTVANGLFTVPLDFGGNFPGTDRWLQIEVRPAGSAVAYTVLTPRQRITSAPYATRAATATAVSGNVSASQIAGGTLSPTVIADGSILAPKIGAVNASVISGTIGDTSLSANIPRLNAAANFTHSLNLTTTQQNPMALTSSAPGGTWLNLANTSSAAATTWSFISTGTANGEGAGKLLFRDADANAVRMTMNGAGAVGIGTTNPEGGILDVEGSVRMNDNELYIRGGTDTGHGLGWYGLGKLYNGFNIDGPVLYGFNGGGLGVSSPDQLVLDWDYNGNVNVGNTSNRGTLNVHGDANIGTASQGASLAVRINDKSIRLTSDGGFPMLQTTSVTAGDVYAGYLRMRHVIEMWPKSDGSAGAKLDVRNSAGSPTITLDGQSGEATVKTLNITGGSDLAEPFPMEDEVEAGSVMIIDEDHPGWLKISSHAYDTRVAGIVSGANGVQPGVSLRQKGVLEEGRNVALTGRVYAFAEATDSPIKPGDLLTTSDRPGYLMKVTDHTRAQGAVIGKAMSRLASGTGMVLVLVNLQ